MRTIQIKRGTAVKTPVLADGELGLQTDTGKLVVGNNGANLPVAMGAELDAVKTEVAGKALANHTHTADQVGARPSNWTPTAADVGARPSTWTPNKWDVGLGNVDNTADSQKSVNYANSANYANAAGNANSLGGRPAGDFYNAGNKPCVAGVYTGNGITGSDADKGGGQFINLGFTPSAVLVEKSDGTNPSSRVWRGLAILGHPLDPLPPDKANETWYGNANVIIDGGFFVRTGTTDGNLNNLNVLYYYIAFK